MCLAIIQFRPEHKWPIQLAFVRDENRNRATAAPGQWWDHNPNLFGGQDLLYQGTWLLVNTQSKQMAAILNRLDNPPPPVYDWVTKSRGHLPLEIIDNKQILGHDSYAPFILVYTDIDGQLHYQEWDGDNFNKSLLSPGLHTFTRHGPNQIIKSPRQAWAQENFADLDWEQWPKLLDGRDVTFGDDSQVVVKGVIGSDTFGTISGTLIRINQDKIEYLFNPTHDLNPDHWQAIL